MRLRDGTEVPIYIKKWKTEWDLFVFVRNLVVVIVDYGMIIIIIHFH